MRPTSFFRRHRLLVALAACAGFGYLAVEAATSEPTLTYALNEAAVRLKDDLGLTLVVGALHAEPGSARIEATPVVVKGSDGVVLFSAKRVAVELAPLQFFARRVKVDALEIDEPRVNLRIEDGRIAGVKELPPDAAGDAPIFRVDVGDFRLRDGELVVDVAGQATATLTGISARLRESGDEGHTLKLSVKRTVVERPGDTIEVDAFGGRLVVTGDGLLAPERVDVSEVVLVSDEASVSLAGTVQLMGPASLVPAFDVDVAATTSLAPLLAHVDAPVAVRGAASLGVRVSARPGLKDLSAVGQGDVVDLDVDGYELGSLRGRFTATQKRFDVEAATWEYGDTLVRGGARVTLDDPKLPVEFEAQGEGFSIYELLASLQVPGSWAEVRVDGEVKGKGTLNPFSLAGSGGGAFRDLVVADRDARTAKVDDRILAAKGPIAADVTFTADTEAIRFDGTIDDGVTRATGFCLMHLDAKKGLVIEATSDRAGFASIGGKIGPLDFTGDGTAEVKVVGPYDDPVITAKASLQAFTLDGYDFGDAAGDIASRGTVLEFRDVHARRGATKYHGDVVLDWTDRPGAPGATPHIDVAVVIDEGRAEEIRAVVPPRYEDGVLGFLRTLDVDGPVQGEVQAKGMVGDGTTDHLLGGGTLVVGEGAALLGQTLAGGRGTFVLDQTHFRIRSLDLATAGGGAHVAADVGRADGDLDGELVLDDLLLARIDALRDAPKPFDGVVAARARVHGKARDPELTGNATLTGAMYGRIPVGDADVKLAHAARVLVLEGALLSSRGRGSITVATRAPYDYTASVRVTPGPAAPLLPEGALGDELKVDVGGVVEAHGQLKAVRQSRGSIALDEARVRYRDVDVASVGDVVGHFHGARITIDRLEMKGPRADRLSVTGSVADDDLDVQIGAAGDVGLLASLVPRVQQAQGRFSLDVAVTGDLDRAAMNGRGAVQEASLRVDGLDEPIEDLDARLVFQGPHVLVEDASARLGGARVDASGTITLAGPRPAAYDVEARFRRMQLSLPKWLASTSSGRLRLQGDADLPTLTGEVQVHQASYTEDINWERLLPDLRRRASEIPSSHAEDDVRYDVHIVADRGIVVENNVLDVEAKGDLYLTGTDERTGLRGNLSLIRGAANFRGNRYRLTRGVVEFTDTYRIAPVLDVEAETRVNDYDVTAHVTGPLRDPTIDLASRPELSEIDILALLTFGFTQYDVRDASGSGMSAGLEVVSAYTGLDREVQRILPEAVRESGLVAVDELRLTSQFSSRQGASVPAVALGLEVNPGIWGVDGSRVRLQSTLLDVDGNGTEQKVEWEKRFENNVRLRLVWNNQDRGVGEGTTNEWGDLGGDVWYRWEF